LRSASNASRERGQRVVGLAAEVVLRCERVTDVGGVGDAGCRELVDGRTIFVGETERQERTVEPIESLAVRVGAMTLEQVDDLLAVE
jgi:hypothetical protein